MKDFGALCAREGLKFVGCKSRFFRRSGIIVRMPFAPGTLDGPTEERPLVLELLRAMAKASKGKPLPFWVGVDDLGLPDNSERIENAIVLAALNGWLSVGGLPAHSITITAEGLKQIET